MHRNTLHYWIICLFMALFIGPIQATSILAPLQPDFEPIDIVYTWVDDKDPVWQQAKNEADTHYKYKASSDAKTKNRFRSRDELKYSLRSVHAYAPFVNHIFIVTFGHMPSWIQPHPKITFIEHSQIFLHSEHLPTFNSQAIESNLHRIPKLSERFIYFNDDMLLGNTVQPTDFFSERGEIKVCFDSGDSPQGAIQPNESAFWSSWKNSNRLLNHLFGQEPRKLLSHAPYALRKSILQQFEAHFPHIVDEVSSHKFRSPDDHVMLCGLIQNIARYEKQATKSSMSCLFIDFSADSKKNDAQLRTAKQKRPHIFCINDENVGNSAAVDAQLHHFFETYYPNAAPWENVPQP